MNATVIRIQGSAWRPRKGGSVKLVIEVRPQTQTEWVEALEMFKTRPEISVAVVPPNASKHEGIGAADKVLYKGSSPQPKITVGDPANTTTVGVDRRYDRDQSSYIAPTVTPIDPGLCECGLIAGHKVKCVKRKVKNA